MLLRIMGAPSDFSQRGAGLAAMRPSTFLVRLRFHRDHDGRELCRSDANEHQAPAGLLVHRARRYILLDDCRHSNPTQPGWHQGHSIYLLSIPS